LEYLLADFEYHTSILVARVTQCRSDTSASSSNKYVLVMLCPMYLHVLVGTMPIYHFIYWYILKVLMKSTWECIGECMGVPS
jgi:hypothetical protein